MNDQIAVFVGPAIDWFSISPLLVLLFGALFLLLVGSLTPQWRRGWYGLTSALTAGTAIIL